MHIPYMHVCVCARVQPRNMLLASGIETRGVAAEGTKDKFRNQLLKALYGPPAMSPGVCVCVCVRVRVRACVYV